VAEKVVYALSEGIEAGLTGGFTDGPYKEFDPSWVEGDDMIFVMSMDGDGPVRPALAEIFEHAERLGSDLAEQIAVYQNNFDPDDKLLVDMIIAKSRWHWDYEQDCWGPKPERIRAIDMARLKITDATVVSPPELMVSVRACDIEALLLQVQKLAPDSNRAVDATESIRLGIASRLKEMLPHAPEVIRPKAPKPAPEQTLSRAERFRT
jgi:hypothetical protein